MRTLENLVTHPRGQEVIDRRELNKHGLITRDALIKFERRVFNTAK